MSLFLYRLGRSIARHRGTVIAAWMLALAALGGGSLLLGNHYDDSFSIPGTESQIGQDLLRQRFGMTGTSGQILFTAKSGKITAQADAAEVASLTKAVDAIHGVSVSNPLTATTPLLNTGSTATIAQVRFSAKVPEESTLHAVQQAASPAPSAGITSSVGGDAYKTTSEPSKVPELLGLLVSFMILAITFGSLLAAGMPIVSSLIGVAVTITAVVVASSLVTVSSTAPTLAEMLGLAVGIDYALFILSRHRVQMGQGVETVESMCRALATAGSAVVFAGATVVIALAGLSVAGIPVLTVMGLGAAFAVAVAVSIALTLLPAVALLLGDRLRPKPRRARRRARRRTPARARTGLATRWVRAVTRWPVVTVLLIVVLLGCAAAPALSLELALPDNSSAPVGTTQRTTYDAITREFGAGYNSPLSITANVITSSDPKSTVSQLADAIGKVPGVVAVIAATPNQSADTALVQAVPKSGQTDPSTAALVHTIRADVPGWEKKYAVTDMLVTGQTAINIDASARLGGALAPFAAIVIGLSLILLMIVFRSIAVPIKATIGYLFSVGTALGAVVVVFEWGWVDKLVPGLSEGPIVSFLPIFVMGVLFGLAMDYEMFLVSGMREHYVVSGDARESVLTGFKASARVVTAAALIMTSVFVAFIPAGSSTIKQIALGLAIGVFVDAFLVRMTLVPAVLMLLGRRAWWLPGWLERHLPVVDVEGAALHRRIAFDDWQQVHGPVTVLARDLVVRRDAQPVRLDVGPGLVHRLVVPPGDEVDLGRVLTGHQRPVGGELVVDGLLLPEQREAVAQRTALIDLGARRPDGSVTDLLLDRAGVLGRSSRHRAELVARAHQLADELFQPGLPDAVAECAMALVAGVDVFVVTGLDQLEGELRLRAQGLAEQLTRRDVTVVVLAGGPPPAPEAPPPGRRHRADAPGPAAPATDPHETRAPVRTTHE